MGTGVIEGAGLLAAGGGVGVLLFLAASWALGVEEIRVLRDLLLRRLRAVPEARVV
jgi:hypothetical protein